MNQEFKLIVAGGRDFSDRQLLEQTILSLANGGALDAYVVSLVSGMAPGADRLAYQFAQQYGVVCHEFPAKWQRPDGSTDKSAGFKRNADMGRFADGLLAFWDGASPGTGHMVTFMRNLGKQVFVVSYSNYPKAGPDVGDGSY